LPLPQNILDSKISLVRVPTELENAGYLLFFFSGRILMEYHIKLISNKYDSLLLKAELINSHSFDEIL
jgi:hypothetical protein